MGATKSALSFAEANRSTCSIRPASILGPFRISKPPLRHSVTRDLVPAFATTASAGAAMRPELKVVAGVEHDAKRALKAARDAARPVLKRWIENVDNLVAKRALKPLDSLVARHLTNYPSANEGRCYAGQERIGEKVGCSARSARRSLKRLRDAGLLATKRGGPGKSASWSFCINGQPIFPARQRPMSAQERPDLAGLERPDLADKPSELKPIERKPPPNPPAPSALDEGGLTGEVLPPASEITFDEFWKAIRHDPGGTGPALAAWRKLSRDDRAAIGALIGPQGIDLDGMWAAVWLAQRRWEAAPLKSARNEWRAACDELRAFVQRTVHLEPHSIEWSAERARKIAAGEPVTLMDTWARDGRGWTVRTNEIES